jgi:hypothetical protein
LSPAAAADPRRLPQRAAAVLAVAGASWGAVALLDPAAGLSRLPPLLLAGAGVAVARLAGRGVRLAGFLALLTSLWCASAWIGPNFGADSSAYFVTLRSVAFDRDLDVTNEWEHWGYPLHPLLGIQRSMSPVGPAVLWSPFYLAAHVWVLANRAFGRTVYEADGLSPPYVRATALGTVAIGLAGAWLLAEALRKRWGGPVAVLAVAGTTLASATVYYLLVQPTMAHGVVFGLAAALVWACHRAEDGGPETVWLPLGAFLGLLVLSRWQALVYVLLVVPIAARAWLRGAVRLRWLAGGAAAALAAFSPQMIAWHVLYGSLVTMPQGRGFLDLRSPYLVDALISADRGLFNWTPILLLGILGLIAALRRQTPFAAGALAVVGATAWINGGLEAWAGSRSFAARRFVLIVPLAAVGLALVAAALRRFAARHPFAVPAAVVGAMVAWNLGLMRLYQYDVFTRAAPLERLAAAQTGQLRGAIEDALSWLGGPRARSLGYKAFVGEYFYDNVNPGGLIQVGGEGEAYLARGWSRPKCRDGWPRFRWALYPEACVRFPLAEPFDLRTTVEARAPRRLEGQRMSVFANDTMVTVEPLPPEWGEVRFTIPAQDLVPGENLLCFRFSEVPPGEEGERRVAAVSRIQLP